MDKLWAPWRSAYLYLRTPKACIFCGKKKGTAATDRAQYLIERSAHAFSMLNLYPYNNGHVMVAPYRHISSIEMLTEREMNDLMRLVTATKKRLDRTLRPHGFNIGMNIGKVSGAGFAGHLHIHIVPRWAGDTNFMPITGGTKVISESLDAMWRLLRPKR